MSSSGPMSRVEYSDTRTLAANQHASPPPSASTSNENDYEKAEAPPTAVTFGDAPDGGAAAWLTVLGAWCISFCTFGWINSVGTFQDYYERELLKEYSASTIAWIPSMQIFFMFAMGPIVGMTHDHYGPRNIILFGSFLHVFGVMMASISSEYYQVMLSQGVCSAIGVACIFQPALSCVGGWFSKKRGAAYGALSTGSSLGGVIFPIMVNRLIKEVGYGWAMRISGFLILGLLIVANLTTRSRLPPHPHSPTKEELMRPFKEPMMLLVTAGTALLTFGIFIPVTYLVVEATASGMSAELAQYLIPILNTGSLFGRAVSGILAVKVGVYNTFIVVCYATGIFLLALWVPGTTNAAIVAFAVLFGFSSGAYVSLVPGLIAEISPPREIGFRTGLMFLALSVGGLTTGPMAGAILAKENGDFLGMKIFAGVFVMVGTTGVLVARLYETGFKLVAKF
ncbi:hypothetical protein VE00_10908 [Pseudogymnoascus sp. WSF 3629]|nr:hypothetical protein VE00_10908 [Pseudogymnoascus sp. WSF 3629]